MKSRDIGKVILNTYLQKRSKIFHIWEQRFCVLTEKFLLIYKGPEKNSSSCDSINLLECSDIKDSDEYLGKNYTFELINKNKRHYFLCNDKDSQEEWIEKIKKILDNKNNKYL